jgi:hypothetical protein
LLRDALTSYLRDTDDPAWVRRPGSGRAKVRYVKELTLEVEAGLGLGF